MKTKALIICLIAMIITPCIVKAQEKEEKERKLSDMIATISDFVTVKGYAQLSYEYNEKDNTNSFYIRRIILFGDVHLHKRVDLFYMFSIGSSFKPLEIWGRFKVCDELNFKIGQMKTPYTMESVMSLSKAEIIEGALPVNYLAGIDGSDKAYSGGQSLGGRDFGVVVEGKLFNYAYTGGKFMEYHVGLFNGQGINLKDKNNHKDFAMSFDLLPTKWLKLTGAGYFGKGYALADVPEDGITEGKDYTRNRWTTGLEIKTNPFMLRAEYLEGKNGKAIARGAYATTTIRMYKNLDLIGSVSYLKKNKDIEGDVCRYIAGAEYRFFNRCRFQLQYQREYDAYAHQPNNQIFTQLQIGF